MVMTTAAHWQPVRCACPLCALVCYGPGYVAYLSKTLSASPFTGGSAWHRGYCLATTSPSVLLQMRPLKIIEVHLPMGRYGMCRCCFTDCPHWHCIFYFLRPGCIAFCVHRQVGLKIEEKGLKASRDSDQAVRDAYFNAADRAGDVTGSGRDQAHRGKVRTCMYVCILCVRGSWVGGGFSCTHPCI